MFIAVRQGGKSEIDLGYICHYQIGSVKVFYFQPIAILSTVRLTTQLVLPCTAKLSSNKPTSSSCK